MMLRTCWGYETGHYFTTGEHERNQVDALIKYHRRSEAANSKAQIDQINSRCLQLQEIINSMTRSKNDDVNEISRLKTELIGLQTLFQTNEVEIKTTLAELQVKRLEVEKTKEELKKLNSTIDKYKITKKVDDEAKAKLQLELSSQKTINGQKEQTIQTQNEKIEFLNKTILKLQEQLQTEKLDHAKEKKALKKSYKSRMLSHELLVNNMTELMQQLRCGSQYTGSEASIYSFSKNPTNEHSDLEE